jgi:hypothetical protein
MGIIALALLIPKGEPSYRRHNLRYWVSAYNHTPRDPRAEGAVLCILTNHTSEVVHYLGWGEREAGQAAYKSFLKLPAFLRRKRVLSFLTEYRTKGVGARQSAAVDSFRIAGTNAVVAIPLLTNLLTTTSSKSPARTIQALAQTGPAGTAALRTILTDKKTPDRTFLLDQLPSALNYSDDAKALMRAAMDDGDNYIRTLATNVFKRSWPDEHVGP